MWVADQLGWTWFPCNTNAEGGETPITEGSAAAAAEETAASSSVSTRLVMEVLSPQARDALTALSENDAAVNSDVILGLLNARAQPQAQWDFSTCTVPPAAILDPLDTVEDGRGSLEILEHSHSVQSVTDDSWTEGFLLPPGLDWVDGVVEDDSDAFSDNLNRNFFQGTSEEEYWHGDESVADVLAAESNVNFRNTRMEAEDAAMQPHNGVGQHAEEALPWTPVIPVPTRELELGQASFAAGATRTMNTAGALLGQFHFRPERRPMQRREPPAECPWGYIGQGRPSSSKVPALASSESQSLTTPPLPIAEVGAPSQPSAEESWDSLPSLAPTLAFLFGFHGENESAVDSEKASVAENED
ncbi:hypothetical protein B0H12DRAFT_1109713 [Mycena haematopus]|nr:hypothetical protein B0H12DRAFT_1109713 [Mycena haematopus]